MIAYLTHAGAFRIFASPQPVILSLRMDGEKMAEDVYTMEGDRIARYLDGQGPAAGWRTTPSQRPGPMRLRQARKVFGAYIDGRTVHPTTLARAFARLGKAQRRRR